jgi:ATP-dependent protease Clp ATPase subunit
MTNDPLACCFCDKPSTEVKKLIANAAVRVGICDECVALCLTIIGTYDRALFDQVVAQATQDIAKR